MGLIKEPLGVDLIVDSRPLTESEEKAISDFIKADKVKRAAKKKRLAKRKAAKPRRKALNINKTN